MRCRRAKRVCCKERNANRGEKGATVVVPKGREQWNPWVFFFGRGTYLESSSRRTEKLERLFDSSCKVTLMLDVNCKQKGTMLKLTLRTANSFDYADSAYQHTSAESTFVPFISSQYIPTILSSCCKLRACTESETIKDTKLRINKTRSLLS